MSGTAFNLQQPAPQRLVAPHKQGTYLTDGRRLFWVVHVKGRDLFLEDASSEALEQWRAADVAASMREVKPSIAAR